MRARIFVKALLFLSVVTLLIGVSAWAADISGKWTAPATSPSGTPQGDRIFDFKVSGDKLTGTVITQNTVNATFEVQGQPKMVGKLTTQSGSALEISDGKISGNDISFVTVAKMGQMEMKTKYTGTISGSEIKFTSEMEMPAGGMPMMGPSSSQGQQQQAPKPQEFTAKRMN
jgi:hypothetical protein